MDQFYLGVHEPTWLRHLDVPLFVSHRRLNRHPRKSAFPPAVTDWALDSGGFTELNLYGRWETTPQQYADAVNRYATEIGRLQWASPMDWMCEAFVLDKTGYSIDDHQHLTVESVMTLRDLVPTTNVIPVLQGFTLKEYEQCIDVYAANGIDLATEPVVGVGSVCRRSNTQDAEDIFRHLAGLGLNLHGFGLKTTAVRAFREVLTSADSLAWSYNARRNEKIPGHTHAKCNNCSEWALRWRSRVLA